MSEEASLSTSATHCLWLPPQRVKDLEEFIQGFYKSLPQIIIVCMNFLEGDIEKIALTRPQVEMADVPNGYPPNLMDGANG
ncbi:hypothetical protein CTI12_AA239760 [Artemisia annua]|uniref:Uncharacterized protein n=1 Tax=Artemisia annua TaxID=35608 RepID=A0A2U1NQE3_ARTAN|nr:hypothetical protein CTI12_AA239760 [Artemisia annua]